jgi:predicted carbohydrate-binding protein with CBM5 and CBM33 domain
MRRIVTGIALLPVVMVPFLVVASPAQAHGYVSSPPSRQALCAQGRVANCGPIQYEPQSVEGPKGLRRCDGGLSRFAVLNDSSRNWPTTAVGSSVTFRWVLTARHATSTWEYFIGGTRIASFNDGGRQPNATVSHVLNLSRYPGRQTVLAVWNIADTPNAFYNCVDLQVGSGSGGGVSPSPTVSPSVSASASPSRSSAGVRVWTAGVTYRVGDEVTYAGRRYRCRQSHTAIYSWEPIYTLALWLPL